MGLKQGAIEAYRNTSLLCEYVDLFLRDAEYAKEQGDSRVLLYRGHSDKNYRLLPSVFRNGLLEKEHLMIQELLLEAPDEFNNSASILDSLIKMQHYRLPTRLLDVTTNPLVALFFACKSNATKDGEIVVIYDYPHRHNDEQARIIASLAEYTGSSKAQLESFLKERGHRVDIDTLTSTTHVPIKVPMNNERIKRQRGAFLLLGIHADNEGNPYQKSVIDLKMLLNEKGDDDVVRTIAVPNIHKETLLNELDIVGINDAFLFPELEHQAEYISQRYTVQHSDEDATIAILIQELRDSGSFQRSHDVISDLSEYIENGLSFDKIIELCKIAKNNDQVGRIIKDSDVKEFYKKLLNPYGSDISDDNIEWVLAALRDTAE